MSIASEINRINANIADAYDEAEAKGATMPATENSANLADTVASIQSTPTLQSKTVTPTTSQQSVTPDSGYDGLSDVTVNATPLEAKTVTPTAQQQVVTPTAPNIGLSSVTVGAASTPTLITKQITENGTYTAADDNADGYSEVTVDVDQQRLLDDFLSMATETVSSDITYLRERAFGNDTTIKNVSFPLCVSCGERPFTIASNIENINMPKLNIIGDYFAAYCLLLHTVNFDSATVVGNYAFALNYDGALEQDIVFSFPNLNKIKVAAFQYRKKVTVILGSICQLSNSNAFSDQAKIYAHQADIDNYYSTATNWSALYANGQIYPIEGSEYE